MLRLILIFMLFSAPFAQGQIIAPIAPAQTQANETLQSSGIFTNDFLGDGQDRWRTVSAIRGYDFLRGDQRYTAYFRAEMIAPDDLTGSSPRPDRRYAGILEAALSRHWINGAQSSYLGGGLTVLGPITGIGSLQSGFHELIGSTEPGVLDQQLPNSIYPLVQAGAAQRWSVPGQAFALQIDAQVGAESLVRAGVEWTLGAQAARPPILRDPVTGAPLSTGQRAPPALGFSVLAGADVAYVADSQLLSSGSVAHKRTRNRAHVGLAWQGEGFSAFYGVTWLSPEFEGQSEGQMLGSLGINLRF